MISLQAKRYDFRFHFHNELLLELWPELELLELVSPATVDELLLTEDWLLSVESLLLDSNAAVEDEDRLLALLDDELLSVDPVLPSPKSFQSPRLCRNTSAAALVLLGLR